jgi:hypothetical protein
MITDRYPTWKKISRDRWESEEGRPNGDGKWRPDFVLERKSGGEGWFGKMRTSAKFDLFETARDAKHYYENSQRRM